MGVAIEVERRFTRVAASKGMFEPSIETSNTVVYGSALRKTGE
jgi:hypothetical protein